MNAPNPGEGMVTAASALADEVAVLRRRVADLQTACDEAQLGKAAMRLAIAGLRRELNGPLSVLVPRVDLMLQEAEERELPRQPSWRISPCSSDIWSASAGWQRCWPPPSPIEAGWSI
jgi:hypothetical protein